MCGITGIWDTSGKHRTGEQYRIVERMTNSLIHRGPDDSGIWQDTDNGVALGFRRLAIRDVSPAGHQPMLSPGGRYAVVFNGEIYNSDALRAELEHLGQAPVWNGSSDTEVMVAAIEAWGLKATVQKLVGMFAIALWDREKRELSLVRDRPGEKPLYYGWAGKTFLFGSELKALRAHPDFVPTLDPAAVNQFLKYAYVPTPLSIYEGIKKLPPASILKVSVKGSTSPEPFWSLTDVITEAKRHPFNGNDTEAVDVFLQQAREAVRSRMIADVPLGAFLSGGLDSSLVVALMQEQSSTPVKTFCIGFTDAKYDESEFASAVAKHLGTEHREHLVTPEEAMSVIPRLPTLFDEPFADPSQIPTFLVSELARKEVTVALSGDGGDELLAGYTSYTHGEQIRNLHSKLGPLTLLAAGAIKAVPAPVWQGVLRRSYAGDRLHKLADVLPQPPTGIHDYLMSHWQKSLLHGINSEQKQSIGEIPQGLSYLESAMYQDIMTYLPDDILAKVDRASMGVSLEARVPLLDHSFIGFCWSLPMPFKRRDGQTKWIMRQALDRYMPRTMFDRPKRGFGLPMGDWLRGPLRPWAEELLTVERLSDGGLLDAAPIRKVLQAHLSGVRNFPGPLWNILMFQAWRESARPMFTKSPF